MTEPNTIDFSKVEYRFTPMPVYVGGYQIGGPMGLQINMQKKPKWIHRTMMRLCLGWEWVDVK